MAEQIVNPTSAAQLASRNSEPTHLGGASWTDIGGRAFDGSGDAESYKVDGAAGISKDSSIPASVPAQSAEKLREAEDDDEVEFEFDDEKKNEAVDDLDKALDEAGDFPETKVDVKTESEDEDEDKDKKVDESGKPWEKDEDDKDDKKVDESDDEDKDDETVKEETEDDKKVDESDDEDETKEKVDESDDEDKDDEKIEESLKISIKLPKTSLFESAGFNPRQQKAVATVFESAIKQTTKQVGKQIHEHYRKIHVAKMAKAQSMMEARLNTYLDVVVEEWMKQNHVAVRQSVRADLAENFLNGLQSLFKEHYIDIPESKVDVVEKLTEEVEQLKTQLNEQYAQKLRLRTLAEAANKKRIVAEFARNLSEVQAAKLDKLAEDTTYVSAKDFREKLTMLKESYFDTRPSNVTRLPEEDVQVIKEETGRKSEVDVVADAISRQVKSDW